MSSPYVWPWLSGGCPLPPSLPWDLPKPSVCIREEYVNLNSPFQQLSDLNFFISVFRTTMSSLVLQRVKKERIERRRGWGPKWSYGVQDLLRVRLGESEILRHLGLLQRQPSLQVFGLLLIKVGPLAFDLLDSTVEGQRKWGAVHYYWASLQLAAGETF